MFRNYLLSSWRSIIRHRSYSIINTIGLSLGIACFVLIGIWVRAELRYDGFHSHDDRIYRLIESIVDNAGEHVLARTTAPLAAVLSEQIAGVEAATRFDRHGSIVQLGDNKFSESGIVAADPTFFQVFDGFHWLAGDQATALRDPYSIVLSQQMAKKYFGEKDPLGKTIRIYQYDPDGLGADYKVTGIISDCPPDSHFHYNFLVSFSTIEAYNPNEVNWSNDRYYTYIRLQPGTNKDQLSFATTEFVKKYHGDNHENRLSYVLQPIRDIHLRSHLQGEIEQNGSLSDVAIFSAVAIIVLILACLNYVSLSIALATDRIREVGVRKVIGALRQQLVGQYLIESLLLTIIAAVVSLLWIELATPVLVYITGTPLHLPYTLEMFGILVGIDTVVGLTSGLYPALFLSSVKTASVLKSQFRYVRGSTLRKGLVFVQFFITMIFLNGILVVQLQMKFIRNRDLGYDPDTICVVEVNGNRAIVAGYSPFAHDLISSNSIMAVSRSNSGLSGGLPSAELVTQDSKGIEVKRTVASLGVDFDFEDVYGMKLEAGRFFSADFASDSGAYVVNTIMAKALGYLRAEDILGKTLEIKGRRGVVIGVLKDFNYNSLHYSVEPVCMYLLNGYFNRISIRTGMNINASLHELRIIWRQHYPGSILEMRLGDEIIGDQYDREERFSQLFIAFSLIALVIASIGLFALVSYSLRTRSREISIRKVMGASVINILGMFFREFIFPVIISASAAIPFAWYIIQKWLQNFAYHIQFSPLIFLLAIGIILAISLFSVGYRSMVSALANPVDALKE